MLSSFILQILFLLCSLTNPLTQAYHIPYCSFSPEYNSTSPFSHNLKQLLSSLPANATKNDWFFMDMVGKYQNEEAYGLAMCHYDASSTSPKSCTTCLTEVAKNMTLECPYSTFAVIWNDECFIRYSNQSFFSNITDPILAFLIPNKTKNILDPIFHRVVNDLMYKLAVDVVKTPKFFAVGEAQYTSSIKVYALAECTRDLPAYMCQECIETYISYYNGTVYYPEAIGYRLVGLNCYTRYEIYPFYNLVSPSSPPPVPPPVPLSGSKSNTVVITVAVVIVAFLAVLAVVGLGIFFWRRSHSKTHENTGDDGVAVDLQDNIEIGLEYILNPNAEYKVFDLITLKNATDNFSEMNKLGKGGFGPVYKGILSDGLEIAVKILSEGSGQGIQEFKNEVDLLAKLKHKNLVQLLGCCIKRNQKMLCYEYLPNGSLDKILFAQVLSNNTKLGWRVRFKIIEGISRGLHYLHEESRLKIIHRDLKASNILLDKDMIPKISDFGMARFFEEDQTHKDTSIVAGTFGYIAPEYILHGNFSAKSDVYSFGILVLEIVTGRKNSSFVGSRRVSNLTDHALQHWNKGKIAELKDPILENEHLDEIKRCVYIALLCVQGNPIDRPNMETVKNMLSGKSKIITDFPLNLPISTLVGCNFSDESYTANTMSDITEEEISNTRSTIKTSKDY